MKPAVKRATLRHTDLIIGRSLITAETVASELRQRLATELADVRGWIGQTQLLERARAILAETEPLLAELIGNADLWSWIAGYHRVASQLPDWAVDQLRLTSGGYRPPPPRPLPPPLFGEGPEAIRFPQLEAAAQSLLEREILTRDDFDAVSDAAKQRAFTVAHVASEDTLVKIRDMLYEDIREGTSLGGFRDRLEATLETSPIGPAHLENVYRTNVQAAFRDGREALASNPIVADVFPYQEYLPITDGRVRPEHLALGHLGLDGTGVYRRDDPMWDYFTPPWDFMCRCGVNLLTVRKAASKGVREAQEWLSTGNPPATPEWCLSKIEFRPRLGFGARVGVRMALAHDVSGEARDAGGKWTAGGRASGHQETLAFVSPNRTINHQLPRAVRAISGPRHQRFKRRFADVDQQIGLNPQVWDVIGKWGGTIENSILAEYQKYRDVQEVLYATAVKGIDAQQKGIYLFQVLHGKHPDATSRLHRLIIPKPMAEVYHALEDIGIVDKTLSVGLPKATGVWIIDDAGSISNLVRDFGERIGVKATSVTGRAIFKGVSGHEKVSEAIAIYRDIVRDYESRFPDRPHFHGFSRRLAARPWEHSHTDFGRSVIVSILRRQEPAHA